LPLSSAVSYDAPVPLTPARVDDAFDVAAAVTITRTSQEDFKSRQLVVSIDGEHAATLLWGDSVTRELAPGTHRVRVHNTLVWKTVDFVLAPGEQVFFEAVNRSGVSTFLLLPVLGMGPLFVTLKRM
jgi:hypothetical protein